CLWPARAWSTALPNRGPFVPRDGVGCDIEQVTLLIIPHAGSARNERSLPAQPAEEAAPAEAERDIGGRGGHCELLSQSRGNRKTQINCPICLDRFHSSQC